MKLEKLLAENMLRFGAKNLDANQIKTLIEQAQSAGLDINAIIAADSPEVKTGVYNDVMAWWGKHIKTSPVQRSLNSWSGSTKNVSAGSSGSKVQDQVLANMKVLKTRPEIKGKTFEDTISKVIAAIEKNMQSNIYLGYNGFSAEPFLNSFKGAKFPENVVKLLNDTNSAQYKSLVNLQQNFDSIWAKINVKQNLQVVVAITDQDKTALLSAIEQRTAKRVSALTNQGKKTSIPEEIKKAKAIVISADKGEITAISKETAPETRTWERSYPDISKGDSTETQNFYLKDNEVAVQQGAQDKFNELIKNTVADVAASGGTVKQIICWAGSKTSQVPTTYNSEQTGYKSGGNIKQGQQGNIKLAEERVKAISSFINTQLAAAFPNVPISVGENQMQPNVGPPFTIEDRAKYSKRTGLGGTDANAQSEYDSKYGPYKGSFGAFKLIIEFKDPGTADESIETVGKWLAKITWPTPVPSDGKPPRGNAGGGKTFVGVDLNTTKCSWKS
jgi:hypothetical protein